MSIEPAKARQICDEVIAEIQKHGFDMATGKWNGQDGGKAPDEWVKWLEVVQSRMDEDLASAVWTLFTEERTRQQLPPDAAAGDKTAKPAVETYEYEWTPTENIVWQPDGIVIRYYPKKGDCQDTPIIGGLVRPLARSLVDGEELVEFVYDGGSTATTLPEMIKLLRNRGQIFDRRAEWILSFLVSKMATTRRVVHATFGVYDDLVPGQLTLNYDVHPRSADQVLVCQQVSPNFKFAPWKHRYMDTYESFNDLFQPFEVRPIIGAQIMANFNEIMRSVGWMCPDIYDWSYHSDTGKTTKADAYTTLLYGTLGIDGETLESAYRMGSLRASICSVIGIHEVENIHQRVWSGMKSAPESPIALRRGTREQGMNVYGSRATFNFTANRLIIRRPDSLKRLIVVHSKDDLVALEKRWRHKSKFDELMANMKPMGFRLLEELLTFNPVFQSRESLIREVAKNSLIIRKIARADEHPLMSSRCDLWGHNLTGNQAWDWLCKICETPHVGLSPEEYYKQVIKVNDIATFESAQDPVEVFLEWFSGWRSEHTRPRRSYDNFGYVDTTYVQGKDELFVEDTLPVPCYYVVEYLIEEYNKKNQANQFGSLKALTLQAADYAGVDPASVLDKDGYAKVIKIGGVTRRVAFVPKDPTPHRKVTPNTPSEEDDHDDDFEEEE
jgi:hypothetical protein